MTIIRVQPDGLIHSHDRTHCLTSGTGVLNPFNCRFCLLFPGANTGETSTIADFIRNESPQANGYSRQVYGRLIQGITTGTPGTITIPSHGLASGVPVFLMGSDGSSVPGGLSLNTKYWVVSPGTDSVQLALSAGGAAIAISSAGTGSFALKVGARTYSDANNRVQLDAEQMTFVATGGQIDHQGFFTLWGSSPQANIIIASIDTGSNQITVSGVHSFSNGEEAMLTADTGGTQPTGVSDSTIYFARFIGPSVITLHPTAADAISNSNAIDITSAGSGTLRLRYAKGIVDINGFQPTSFAIQSGQEQRFNVVAYAPNTGAGIGV